MKQNLPGLGREGPCRGTESVETLWSALRPEPDDQRRREDDVRAAGARGRPRIRSSACRRRTRYGEELLGGGAVSAGGTQTVDEALSESQAKPAGHRDLSWLCGQARRGELAVRGYRRRAAGAGETSAARSCLASGALPLSGRPAQGRTGGDIRLRNDRGPSVPRSAPEARWRAGDDGVRCPGPAFPELGARAQAVSRVAPTGTRSAGVQASERQGVFSVATSSRMWACSIFPTHRSCARAPWSSTGSTTSCMGSCFEGFRPSCPRNCGNNGSPR